MNDTARARLEKELHDNPPGNLTDPVVVRKMCIQNDESMQPVIEQIDRMHANSLAQMFTKVIR